MEAMRRDDKAKYCKKIAEIGKCDTLASRKAEIGLVVEILEKREEIEDDEGLTFMKQCRWIQFHVTDEGMKRKIAEAKWQRLENDPTVPRRWNLAKEVCLPVEKNISLSKKKTQSRRLEARVLARETSDPTEALTQGGVFVFGVG